MSPISVPLPDAVLDRVRRLADLRRVTPEEYVSQVVDEATSAEDVWRDRVERGRRVTREQFIEVLDRAPDVEPEPYDRIE